MKYQEKVDETGQRWLFSPHTNKWCKVFDKPAPEGEKLTARAANRVQKRKPFKINFVKLPGYWIERLKHARHLATFRLAHHILREDHKQKYGGGGDIVLSTASTGLPRTTRWLATKEMVGLGLIQVQQDGRQAVRVTKVFDRRPGGAR
jgi:hypothetical protein